MPSRRHRFVLTHTAMVAVLALAGCGSDGVADARLATAERTYIADAIPHHHLGMELIELAGPRAHDVRFRRLVFEQGQYHGSELDQLETWGQEWSIAPSAPGFPGDLADAELARLRSTQGAAFDIAWLKAMIEHHQGYLVFADAATAARRTKAVDEFADRTAEVQRAQIAEMKALLTELEAGG